MPRLSITEFKQNSPDKQSTQREITSAGKRSHEHNTLESPTVNLRRTSKYKVQNILP